MVRRTLLGLVIGTFGLVFGQVHVSWAAPSTLKSVDFHDLDFGVQQKILTAKEDLSQEYGVTLLNLGACQSTQDAGSFEAVFFVLEGENLRQIHHISYAFQLGVGEKRTEIVKRPMSPGAVTAIQMHQRMIPLPEYAHLTRCDDLTQAWGFQPETYDTTQELAFPKNELILLEQSSRALFQAVTRKRMQLSRFTYQLFVDFDAKSTQFTKYCRMHWLDDSQNCFRLLNDSWNSFYPINPDTGRLQGKRGEFPLIFSELDRVHFILKKITYGP